MSLVEIYKQTQEKKRVEKEEEAVNKALLMDPINAMKQWFEQLCSDLVNTDIWFSEIAAIKREVENGRSSKNYDMLRYSASWQPKYPLPQGISYNKALQAVTDHPLRHRFNKPGHLLHDCLITLHTYRDAYNLATMFLPFGTFIAGFEVSIDYSGSYYPFKYTNNLIHKVFGVTD